MSDRKNDGESGSSSTTDQTQKKRVVLFEEASKNEASHKTEPSEDSTPQLRRPHAGTTVSYARPTNDWVRILL